VIRERIERFLQNLSAALGYCIAEDITVLDIAIPALICLGILWFVQTAVYDFILDSHGERQPHSTLSPSTPIAGFRADCDAWRRRSSGERDSSQ